MKNSGLTEKKMKNKKFRQTEMAIFAAYYKLHDFPSAKTIAKRANISRSTLYRHHALPRAISNNYEKYLLDTYSNRIKKSLRKKSSLKTLFFRTLIFIHSDHVIFEALFESGHKEIIKRMLDKLKKQILKEWNYAGDTNKLYKVYQNEVLGIIELWGEHGFGSDKIEELLDDILYLNKTAPKRLSRFLES
ncbi:TetR/AcrR family transcriptional regulator [Candidatus Saccharibacteria bacterium]|nr:TetR/AcrR family transcriptional regulator [Candidatus Saccharibacteria bacterium]